MARPREITHQINVIISKLIQSGLSNDQNFAIARELGAGKTEVTFRGAEHLSLALKGRSYAELYRIFRAERVYSVLCPDGALLQLSYMFQQEVLERSRLAFLPSPDLTSFQSDPELYLEDTVFAEIVQPGIVPFPLRFDFDAREHVFEEIRHPKSHLTLGQYEACRIPLSAPMTPAHFFDFILRNLYSSASLNYFEKLPRFEERFEDCIAGVEESLVHVRVPFRLLKP